jgi:hypothetical protein
VAVIAEAETTVNAAGIPLKGTLVVPVKFVPRIVTADSTALDSGTGLMSRGKPAVSL